MKRGRGRNFPSLGGFLTALGIDRARRFVWPRVRLWLGMKGSEPIALRVREVEALGLATTDGAAFEMNVRDADGWLLSIQSEKHFDLYGRNGRGTL